ncbi:hypothetical protein Csa_008919 [Cucumis sativus]|uniref:TCP domain-containing protein n=2 Tax=Cucumis sativus TaxID=3659 RepID=A0A0A0KRR2_CUCSA|nr:hypothetical protein Csa_008919 [Cucumis sativus]
MDDHQQQQHQEDQILINSYDDHDFHYFPHPFLDDDDLFLSHFLSQQQQFFEQRDQQLDETTKKMKKKKKLCGSSSSRKNGSNSTKRRGKKDRHSKIYTAQGPRDRRMRLSLQIARKFFDLQDMLGFDKASKTIEWLLLNSNSAIKDLKQAYFFKYSNSGQSSEVVSEINDNNGVFNVAASNLYQEQDQEDVAFTGGFKDKIKSRTLRTVAREARDRARARARQRTLLKNTLLPNPPITSSISQHFDHLSGNNNISSSSNNNNNTYLDYYPTFSCPSTSIFLPSPLPLPYSFTDSTLLKLP